MTLVSCMGGWCTKRDTCSLHLKEDRSEPVERLCDKGKADSYEPIKAVHNIWETVRVAKQEWCPQ